VGDWLVCLPPPLLHPTYHSISTCARWLQILGKHEVGWRKLQRPCVYACCSYNNLGICKYSTLHNNNN
jgi:hypothetical protein